MSANELIPADENDVARANETKSDFAKQSQFFLKLKKPKAHLCAVTIYFRKKPT